MTIQIQKFFKDGKFDGHVVHLKSNDKKTLCNQIITSNYVLTDNVKECTCDYCKKKYIKDRKHREFVNKFRRKLNWPSI